MTFTSEIKTEEKMIAKGYFKYFLPTMGGLLFSQFAPIVDSLCMVFDEFNIHPEKESERRIVDWDRTYFLTKYYVL